MGRHTYPENRCIVGGWSHILLVLHSHTYMHHLARQLVSPIELTKPRMEALQAWRPYASSLETFTLSFLNRASLKTRGPSPVGFRFGCCLVRWPKKPRLLFSTNKGVTILRVWCLATDGYLPDKIVEATLLQFAC